MTTAHVFEISYHNNRAPLLAGQSQTGLQRTSA